MSKYVPCIDNYLTSMPPTNEELWRTELQLLYDSMKLSIADPLAIDGQWFDVHEEHGEGINPKFRTPEGKVIVGARGIVFAEIIPRFLESHQSFFDLVEKLDPGRQLETHERRKAALEIPESYKCLIDIIKETHELTFASPDRFLARLPEEFSIRSLLETHIARELKDPCFRYPHISGGLPSRDYTTALGSYHILKDRAISLTEEGFQFIPADQQYFESLHPGSLTSYKGRIRFFKETFERIDLTKARTELMFRLLLE